MADNDEKPADVGTRTIATEPALKPAPKTEDADTVEVRQLRPWYNGPDDDRREISAEPLTLDRSRAAEMRAAGFVEYVKDEDGEREAEDAGKKARDAVRASLKKKG